MAQEIRRLSEQLKYTSVDLENIKEQFSDETNNVSHLEKLNRDMNKENKRLMMEIVDTQKKMKKEAEESEDLKIAIGKLENEQTNVENMLLKTQHSNSELMDANKSLKDDLKHANGKITDLQNSLENMEKQKIIVENKLLNLEKEFDDQGRKEQKEMEDMSKELQQSRAMINEFEAILDQGQLDFDEMDIQLDKYRQENNELDQRLHGALKQQIRLQSEREELDRKVESITGELSLLQSSVDNEKKFSNNCIKEKEMLEATVNELKINLELFEERVKKMEIESEEKEEMIEKKENEKERFRQDLIDAQKEIDQLRSTTEELELQQQTFHQKETEQASVVNELQGAEASLRNEIEQLTHQLQIKTELVEEQDNYIEQLKDDGVNYETNTDELLSQMQQLENELEEVKERYAQEKSDLLEELDRLKTHITEREIESETTSYDVKKLEHELSETLQNNERLAEKLHDVITDTDMERETMIETIAHLEEKLNNIDSDQWGELQDLRTTLQTYEQMKEEEMKELQANNEALLREDVIKTREINKLRENLRKTESALESSKSTNTKLTRSLSDVEQEKTTSYTKLRDDLASKESSLRILEERTNAENEQRSSLLKEVEKLQEANRNLFQEKLEERQRLENQIDELKSKMVSYDFLERENENMKIDIENLLSESQSNPSTFIELSQLRSQVTALRVKAERVDELLMENRMLKQSLRENDAQKADIVNLRANANRMNALVKENNNLKLELDELQKQQQHLQEQKPTEYNSIENNQSINDLASENRALINENDQLKQQIRALENKIRSLESQQNNGSLSARMNAERVNQLTNENRALRQQLESRFETKSPSNPFTADTQKRNNELTNENRVLKQELREIENKHIQSLESIKQDNSKLQRSVDDLLKKNQELELRNVNVAKASKPKNVVFFDQAAKQESLLRQKASSFDNLQQASWKGNNINGPNNISFDMSSSSGYQQNKLPVATSTPMKENVTFLTTSSAPIRSNSMENLAISNQVKTSPFKSSDLSQRQAQQTSKPNQDSSNPSNITHSNTTPFIRQMTSQFDSLDQQNLHQQKSGSQNIYPTKNDPENTNGNTTALKSRSDTSQFSIEAFNLEMEQDPVINQYKKQKADASWFDKPKDEGLEQSSPIKNNPFFELDKSAPKQNWKKAVKTINAKSVSADNSPTKSFPKSQQISIDFDMRPRSTEPGNRRRGSRGSGNSLDNSGNYQHQQQQQRQHHQQRGGPLDIGNDFVKRLKGVFEGQDVTGR